MKTYAAILTEQKQPLALAEIELPELSYGQVRVELSASRICGSQLGEIDGVKGPDRWLPHLLGHEGCGYVREVGPEVRTVKPGDKVCLHWRPGDGIEARPPQYKWGSKTVNAGYITTFNHQALISENRMTVIPDEFDDEIACLLADTITTGFGIISNDAQAKIGESVVVISSGGIGLGVIQAAKLAGAHPIIAVDIHDRKLDVAKQFGATHAINSRETSFLDAAREILGGAADIVVDGTGSPDVIQQAYKLASKAGKVVLFGVMPQDRSVELNTLPLHFGKTLTGSEGGASKPAADIPRYVRMIQDGLWNPKPMVSHRGTLEEVNELIDRMRAGEVIHAIMRYTHS